MYKIIEKEETEDFFGKEEEDLFFDTIRMHVLDEMPEEGLTEKGVYGSIVLSDVFLKNGDKTNVYLEFHGVPFLLGLDVIIKQIIIYDEIPDIVLDRINMLKEHEKESDYFKFKERDDDE